MMLRHRPYFQDNTSRSHMAHPSRKEPCPHHIFQVLLPMVTGPYIGVAVIKNTGMTYEDLGTVKQVPTAEIFLAAAVVLLLLVGPVALLKRREKTERSIGV